jgi:hypothetical protein
MGASAPFFALHRHGFDVLAGHDCHVPFARQDRLLR